MKVWRITCKFLLIAAGALACCTANADPAVPPIVPGDPRDGYEDAGYRTDSRRIPTGVGTPADLAELARNPPLGLPPLPEAAWPEPAAIRLGRRLFHDRRLSANATLSCAMCHVAEQGFTQNELRTPVGIEGRFVHRNAPTLYNVAYVPALFHDGREPRLEAQVWSPLLAHNEMGNTSRGQVLDRVRSLDDYAAAFAAAFADGLNETTLGQALASYQRALLSADSPFDRWYFGGDSAAVNDAAKRGFAVFVENDCAACHLLNTGHALFTDDDFHDTGIGYRAAQQQGVMPDKVQIAPGVIVEVDTDIPVPHVLDDGRGAITGNTEDRWRYRTPGLRNVALTAPYMHDGSIPTLEAVVAYYAAGGVPHPGQDPLIRPLNLSAEDARGLVTFLVSLTGSNVAALAADARAAPIGDAGR